MTASTNRKRLRLGGRSAGWWAGAVAITLAVALLIAAGVWIASWTAVHPVASRGGLYFAKRVELTVPIFAQCDPRWRQDLVGPTPDSMGAVGCAVTSAAMVLASYGVDTDPGRLNRYLTDNGGYTPQGWMYWEKAAELSGGKYRKRTKMRRLTRESTGICCGGIRRSCASSFRKRRILS